MSTPAPEDGNRRALYDHLFRSCRREHPRQWRDCTAQRASVALHEKFGLAQIAHFKEVASVQQVVDVGYWQRIL